MGAGMEAGAVVRSPEGGRSWQDHRRGAKRACHQLAAHATLHGHLYEGGYGGGAYSTDAGATWQRPPGLDRRDGWAVAALPGSRACWDVSVTPPLQSHTPPPPPPIFLVNHLGLPN